MSEQSSTRNSSVQHTDRTRYLFVILFVFVIAFLRFPSPLEWRFQTTDDGSTNRRSSQPLIETKPSAVKRFVTKGVNKQVHAASIEALPEGGLVAVWYGGSREGHSDVSVQISFFDPHTESWSTETSLVTLKETQNSEMRFARKLGNPVVFLDATDKLWVFYVSVSIGGWSGASANFVTSSDYGKTFSDPQKIVSAPLFNMCSQIKTRPILFSDHTIGLPVHHEMGLNFCSILRLNAEGRPVSKTRLTYGKITMQPLPLVIDEENATVLMRYHSMDAPQVVQRTRSDNGGQTWSPTAGTNIPNGDSAVGGVAMSNGTLIVAANDFVGGRNQLSLYASRDGGTHWNRIHLVEYEQTFLEGQMEREEFSNWLDEHLSEFDQSSIKDKQDAIDLAIENTDFGGGHRPAFGYPYLIQNGDQFHLVYTWNRSHIVQFQFNQAWLNERLEEAFD